MAGWETVCGSKYHGENNGLVSRKGNYLKESRVTFFAAAAHSFFVPEEDLLW